jgi:radical SAM superfamily enzyme YgiQ (UPF0313 family)
MKVLFLNPPFLPGFSRSSRSPAVAKSSTLYYPIFLSYTAGVVEAEGHEVLLMDGPAMKLSHDEVYERVSEWKPDLCVADTSTPSIYNDVEVVSEIKKRTGAKTCLVGTHVSALPEESLQLSESIDFIACREYDYTIRELVKVLALESNPGQEELDAVKGIVFRTGNNHIHHTGERPLIDDLDAMPFVSKVYKKYLNSCLGSYFYGATLHPVVTIMSGRGCPHRCAYCVYPQTMMGHVYRYRSVANVVDELEYISKEFPQVREVFMEDDTLTINKDRCRELAEEILKRKLKITWTTNSRADVDMETMVMLKRAGLRLLCVGFESGEQQVLDNLGKNLKVEQAVQFAREARKAGVLVHGCFMVGNRGENQQTLKKTLNLALKINPDTAQFFPIMVYPGTRAYEWAREKGYITVKNWREWVSPEGLHKSVVSTPDLSARDLVKFCDEARRKYYLRPSYILGKISQVITRPKEAKRIFRSAKNFFKYLIKGSDV